MHHLRQRLAREEGFTLLDLLIVIVIIGILLAIAIPSYLGFRDRANKSSATSDVRSAVPSAEAYFSDYGDYAFDKKADGTVALTTIAALQSYDSGLKLGSAVPAAGNQSYCLTMVVDNAPAHVVRPAATPGQTGTTEANKKARGEVFLDTAAGVPGC